MTSYNDNDDLLKESERMMMNKKWRSSGILFFVLLFCCMVHTVSAEEKKEASVQTYVQGLSSISLSGYQSMSSQYFELESYWDVVEAVLHLQYDSSPLVNEELSSMTLYVNGTPFHSFRPEAEKNQELFVTIPKDLLIEGVNSITLEGTRTTSTDEQLYNVCAVEDVRDNWMTIKDASSITIRYASKPIQDQISDIYQRFTGIDTSKNSSYAIVVSDDQSAAELEAAIYSIAGLSKAKSNDDKRIPLLIEGDQDITSKRVVLYISKTNQLPATLKDQLGDTDLTDQALIKLVRTGGEQAILLVTSDSDELLVKAGRYVANQELMEQTTSAEKTIDANTDVLTPPVSVSQFIKLTETGDKLTGPMHHEKSYFISLPANQSIADASKIRLDLRYAQNLNFNRSLVTVLINDKPIGSKKLSEVMANQDVLELSIPKNLDVNGNFTVKVAFDLEIESLPCTVSQDQMPWAYIDSTSTMQLNTVDRSDLLFNYYPSNFMRGGGFNSIAVVMPEQLTAADYRTLSNIFHLLGRYVQTNHGAVNLYRDSVDDATLENKHIIAIGSYKNNALIRQHNEQMYFQYDASGAGFISNEKKSIESEYGKRIGSLQLLPSPYSEGYGMMVVTGAEPQYYELASQSIASEGLLWKLYGDSIIIDKDGNLSAYRFKEELQQSSGIMNVIERDDVQSFLLSAVLTMTVALIALILLTRKHWRKRRKIDETNSKQLNI